MSISTGLHAPARGGPVTQRMFRVDEGADMHCQVGNLSLSNAVVYDWLGDVFRT